LILAAGNGVRHGDLPLLHALAQEIGASVGASRVAVDAGHFARHQQIGATGKAVSASAYLALGISGAVQHLQGIKDCRHVIAVNLDASAPITGRAHLSVIEDSAALMQALIEISDSSSRSTVALFRRVLATMFDSRCGPGLVSSDRMRQTFCTDLGSAVDECMEKISLRLRQSVRAHRGDRRTGRAGQAQ
ncbi:electron transfer flavoprotein subunit alpha/FixB family protein, partial [Verminephrobacter sp. Larva24]